jgi:hypothetical protein
MDTDFRFSLNYGSVPPALRRSRRNIGPTARLPYLTGVALSGTVNAPIGIKVIPGVEPSFW